MQRLIPGWRRLALLAAIVLVGGYAEALPFALQQQQLRSDSEKSIFRPGGPRLKQQPEDLRPAVAQWHLFRPAIRFLQTVHAGLDHERFLPEEFAIHGSDLYLFLPNGMGKSKLAIHVVRALKVPTTIRTWSRRISAAV